MPLVRIEKIWHEPEHPTCNVTVKALIRNCSDKVLNVWVSAQREDGKRFLPVEIVHFYPGSTFVYDFVQDSGDGWCLPDGCYKYTFKVTSESGELLDSKDYVVCIGTAGECPIKCEKLEVVKTEEYNVILRGTFKNYSNKRCTREFDIKVHDLTGGGWIPYSVTVTLDGGEIGTKDIYMRLGDGEYEACLYDGLIKKCVRFTVSKKQIRLTADRTKIHEGETVKFTADIYGTPSTSVKTCVYVEGRRGDCYWVSLDNSGHGVLNLNATFPSYGTYHIKVCVVNPLTNEPAYCSNEVTITVEKVGKPKLEITINVDKTEVNIGDKVKVYGEVKNVGDGTFSGGILHIYANDKEVTHIPVISLPPNHSQSFSYEIVLWSVGDYSIKACVEGDGMKVCSNPVTVRVAEPKVTISDPIAEKTSAVVGETVRISWKIRNESSVKVNATVQSYVNDKPYKGEVIYLNPKEEKEFSISIEFGEAGDYKVYACVEEVKVL